MEFNQLVIFFCCVMCTANASAIDLNKKITNIIGRGDDCSSIGVIIQDVDKGNVLYEHRANEYFLPASTIKLFTAAAALYKLGPNFNYQTEVKYNNLDIKRGVLFGDVVLQFRGDPSFSSDNLKSLLRHLQDGKIKKIEGDIWIEDSCFNGPLIGRGWSADSIPWYYAAPAGAVIIDQNQFALKLHPSGKLGDKVSAELIPQPNAKFVQLKTNIKSVTYQESETLCQLEVEVTNDNKVSLGGCWPLGEEASQIKLSLRNMRKHIQQMILNELQHLGIVLQGDIQYGKYTKELEKQMSHRSPTLQALLPSILADSNNLYADSLAKTLGLEFYGVGSFQTGVQAIMQILAKPTGINFEQMRLLDGSGLSRYNLVMPRQLSRLLYTMYHEPRLGPYFKQALTLSGSHGTLKNRLTSFDAKEKILAKTGSLEGTSALAGYLTTRSNKQLIVTIMLDRAVNPGLHLKKLEDELCYLLLNEV